MADPTRYFLPPGDACAAPGASIGRKLVQFPRISNDEPPFKSSTPTRSFSRKFLSCFSFLQSKEPAVENHSISPTKQNTVRQIPPPSTVSALPMSRMESHVDSSPYAWPHDSSFDPKTTALVIIDMQKDFCSPEGYLQWQGYDIAPVREIIPRVQQLLSAFRSEGFPVYHTREGHRPDLSTLSSREHVRSRNNQYQMGIGDKGPLGRLLVRGEPGHDIIPELYPLSSEQIIDKPARSAFQHTEFKLMLNIKGIKNLIICGVTTDVCVTSTMRDANDNNFDCLLVEDATAASEAELHKGAVEMVKTEGGVFGAVSSTKKILAALGTGNERKFMIPVVDGGSDFGEIQTVPSKHAPHVKQPRQ